MGWLFSIHYWQLSQYCSQRPLIKEQDNDNPPEKRGVTSKKLIGKRRLSK